MLSNSADAIERILKSYKEVTELAGYAARVSGVLRIFAAVEEERRTQQAQTCDGNGGCGGEDSIRFVRVPIATPTGDVLVERLSFELRVGEHLFITGPNGCGKSSLLRTLGGLWAHSGGELHRPAPSFKGRPLFFYIPQRPYLTEGSLRAQVVYPEAWEAA
jgi:ATP-binding cassette subfamily D (ALD) long-chain fatty acid import protein